jgi:hypothetical protein
VQSIKRIGLKINAEERERGGGIRTIVFLNSPFPLSLATAAARFAGDIAFSWFDFAFGDTFVVLRKALSVTHMAGLRALGKKIIVSVRCLWSVGAGQSTFGHTTLVIQHWS